MRGIDKAIWGFSYEGWSEFVDVQLSTPVTTEEGRGLRRQFFPFAETVELDKQGRFVIPDDFLKIEQIKEKIVLIGAGDHFEIWNPKKWQTELKK